MRLVFVEWLDSSGCSAGWQELEGASGRPVTCKSVGWLFHDAKDCKVIIPHLSVPAKNCPAQGAGDMTIPAKSVVRMVTLREPKPERSRLAV